MIKIDGLDKIFKKLDKLSHIETEKAVEEVAKDVESAIRNKAKTFSDTSYMYVGQSEKRKYGKSCYIDVGFHKDNADFEKWKSLWFQNWGYFDYGWNFSGQIYIQQHQLWFNEAVQSIGKETQKKLKEKIRQEIKGALK